MEINELEINSVTKYELHKETLNVIHFKDIFKLVMI